MVSRLRRWHETLLHRIIGLPERHHTKSYVRSHPVVPARHRLVNPSAGQSLQMQATREMQREPQTLRGWQLQIRQVVERRGLQSSARRDPRAES